MRRDWDSFWNTCWKRHRRQFSEGAAAVAVCAAVPLALVLLGVLPPDALWLVPLVPCAIGMIILVPLVYLNVIRACIGEARERRHRDKADPGESAHPRPW